MTLSERQKSLGIAAAWAAAFLVLCLLLTACAGGGQQLTDRQKLLVACDTYASTLNALAAQRQAGNLSEDQVETVNNVRAVMNPICNGDLGAEGQSLDEALAEAETQLFKLQGVRDGD